MTSKRRVTSRPCHRVVLALVGAALLYGCSKEPASEGSIAKTGARLGRPEQPASAKANCKRGRGGRLPKGCVPEYAADAWGSLGLVTTNMGIAAKSVEGCFSEFGPTGTSPFIPPLSAECRHAPNRECQRVTPETATGAAWEFQLPSEKEAPEWYALGVTKIFEQMESMPRTLTHHVRFGWSNVNGCRFEIESVADVDDDGYWASNIMRYTLDINGELAYSWGHLHPEEPGKRDLPMLRDPPEDAVFRHDPNRTPE